MQLWYSRSRSPTLVTLVMKPLRWGLGFGMFQNLVGVCVCVCLVLVLALLQHVSTLISLGDEEGKSTTASHSSLSLLPCNK